ncbi:MAG: sulfite exporter TauE/SafE family protein [Oscillatoriales cyanobacterium C42_A2020_001]|nr:sulfite exporter TauE/SafE family protein [Leptolyngbyaceae cyanobacterium C42_A2020_001]
MPFLSGTTVQQLTPQKSWLAFLYSVPIGVLGGLMGLGGAEYRLPVLVAVLKYTPHQAVQLNLAVSLITILVSLPIRAVALSLTPILPILPIIFSLIAGAVITAFYGATLAKRLSSRQLAQTIMVLLVAIGVALVVEAFLPQLSSGWLAADSNWRIPTGIVFGLGIGLVSSLLGVAGGEVIIPTLIFAFGVDIKTAGTASLMISLPTVATGLVRYAAQGAFQDRRPLVETVMPMGIGSMMGALIGGLLVGIVSTSLLKLMLGIILVGSALKIFHHSK